MKAALIITGSILMTTTVIGNAFYLKKQFYPSIVFITKSHPSLAVIYAQCLVVFLLVGKLMRKIFFGTLRAAELEHLIERSWYAVTETCLAFTVFRDDLTPRFIGVFAILLFLKCFHWLAEDRVDFMERSPNINILFHIRIVSLLTLLAACDIGFIYYAYMSILAKGPGTHIVFGFEYAILLVAILNIFIKYVLHWVDLTSENPWDEKAVCLLYTELGMGFIRLALYLIFMAAMIKYQNIPIFALRPIYLSYRTLKKAFCDVVMSRRAINNMNTLYPDATREELENTDNVCIICREEMSGNGASKKLPCNHIFHVSCLRSWFQRQQTCPTCRMDILRIPETAPPQARQATPRATNNQQPQAAHQNWAGQPMHNNNNNSTNNNNNNINNNSSGLQQRVFIQDDVAALMIQSFAHIFVQAMLNHLQALNRQQQQQQDQVNNGSANSSSNATTNMQPTATSSSTATNTSSPTTASVSTSTNESDNKKNKEVEQVKKPDMRDSSTQTECAI